MTPADHAILLNQGRGQYALWSLVEQDWMEAMWAATPRCLSLDERMALGESGDDAEANRQACLDRVETYRIAGAYD